MIPGNAKTLAWVIGGGVLLTVIPAFILGMLRLGPIDTPSPTVLFFWGSILGYVVGRPRKPKA